MISVGLAIKQKMKKKTSYHYYYYCSHFGLVTWSVLWDFLHLSCTHLESNHSAIKNAEIWQSNLLMVRECLTPVGLMVNKKTAY